MHDTDRLELLGLMAMLEMEPVRRWLQVAPLSWLRQRPVLLET